MDNVLELKWRKAVRESVVSCQACNLVKVANHPVPFTGASLPTVAVVGEAPGREEDVQAKPFVGPSGRLLRKWLFEDVGFNEREVSFVNTVSCWPNRTPTGKEVEACKKNLVAQLSYLRPKYILALGGVAFNALLAPGVMRMGDGRGKWFRAEGYGLSIPPPAIATWHPAAVLRNRTLERKAIEDVMYLRLVAKEEEDPFVTNCWENGLCWYPGCMMEIDNEYKGLYSCPKHPIKVAGLKEVSNVRAGDSAGGAGEPVGQAAGPVAVEADERLF